MNDLLAPFAYDFMQRATLITVMAGVVSALLSCWVTQVGWSLIGDAVSHAVLPGVALAYMVGLPFAVGALVFGVGAVALIAVVRDTSVVKEDAAIGVVFTTLFAGGLVLVAMNPSQVDLQHILFGSILGLSAADVVQVVVLGAIALAVIAARHRDFTLYAFDPAHAQAMGVRPKRVATLLLGVLSVTVVVSLQAVGVVLAVAMLITPGVTARMLTDSMPRMLIVAPATSVVCALLGVQLSYWWDAPTGALVVLLQGVLFTLVYLLHPTQGVRALLAGARRRARMAS